MVPGVPGPSGGCGVSLARVVRALDRFVAGEVSEAELREEFTSLTSAEATLIHDLVALDARLSGHPLECDGEHS